MLRFIVFTFHFQIFSHLLTEKLFDDEIILAKHFEIGLHFVSQFAVEVIREFLPP